MPSEVAGSSSASASSSWTKKPSVTSLSVITEVTTASTFTSSPTRGEASPSPWMVLIGVKSSRSLTTTVTVQVPVWAGSSSVANSISTS